MPASIVFELLFRFVFEIVFYAIGYFTGKVLVGAFTFGSWGVADVPPPKRAKGSRRERSQNQLPPKTISETSAVLIGLVFWAMVIALGFAVVGIIRG